MIPLVVIEIQNSSFIFSSVLELALPSLIIWSYNKAQFPQLDVVIER